jgi:hypothetical protein
VVLALSVLAALACLFTLAASGARVGAQEPDKMDSSQLKETLTELGYDTKVLNTEAGKEKFEFTEKTKDLTIPIGAEISPSKNYLWLTVNLGDKQFKDGNSYPKSGDLLRKNADIQPCFFYVTTKGHLMMGLALENRGLTNPWIRKCIEKLSADVSSTQALW